MSSIHLYLLGDLSGAEASANAASCANTEVELPGDASIVLPPNVNVSVAKRLF